MGEFPDRRRVSVSASFVPYFLVVVAFALAQIWQRGAELADLDEHTV